MRGVSVLTDTGRFAWNSWEHPAVAGRTRGKPAWQWMDARSAEDFKRALTAVQFERQASSAVEAAVTVGGESLLFSCEVRRILSAGFIVLWHKKPLNPVRLTKREQQMLLAVCRDEPEKVTAVRLGISRKTVETHRANLRRKTGARGPATLARWAISTGLIDP